MNDKEIRDLLRRHQFRATRGRIDLLRVLYVAKRPLTHAEILNRLKGSAFNRVSLYRALEALVNAGLVHRAYLQDRAWSYETSERCEEHQCHPHFTCRSCGSVSCLTDVAVPLVKGLPRGYLAERQKVHIDGVCADCSMKTGGKR
jgi:Fur family ferric uptake transcriptional regulator